MSTTAHDLLVRDAQARVFAPALMTDVFTVAEFRLYTTLAFQCFDLDTLAEAEQAVRAIVAERTGVVLTTGGIDTF